MLPTETILMSDQHNGGVRGHDGHSRGDECSRLAARLGGAALIGPCRRLVDTIRHLWVWCSVSSGLADVRWEGGLL